MMNIKNLIKLGEKSNRIFNFGAPSIENISQNNLSNIHKKFKNKTFLVTYHPNTIFPKKKTKSRNYSANGSFKIF